MPTSSEFPDRAVEPRQAQRAGATSVVPPSSPAADETAEPTPAVRSAVRRLRREHERSVGPTRFGSPDAGRFWPGQPGRSKDAAVPEALIGPLAQLRAATTRCVFALRGDGARPEQMLVRVKACVREALTAEGWQDPETVQAITAAVVAWSIEAYYDR